MTVWDPVSKQPYFKTAACRVTKVRDGDGPAPAPTTAASAPATASTAAGRQPDATSAVAEPHRPQRPGRSRHRRHYALDPQPRRGDR